MRITAWMIASALALGKVWAAEPGCEVRQPDLTRYVGGCADGLADGVGEAQSPRGVVTGTFRAGLLHGETKFQGFRGASWEWYWRGQHVGVSEFGVLERAPCVAGQRVTVAGMVDLAQKILAKTSSVVQCEATLAELRENDEEYAYAEMSKSNDDARLREFLARFPAGRHAAAVRERLDRGVWAPYRTLHTKAGYEEFIVKFPENQYVVDARKALEDLASEEEAKRVLPKAVREVEPLRLCTLYGQALRGQGFPAAPPFYFHDVKFAEAALGKELRRRGLAADRKLAVAEKIRIGMSHCALYAAWGEPDRVNRSVGIWGVHTQEIYGNAYVYVQNGKVTGWQD